MRTPLSVLALASALVLSATALAEPGSPTAEERRNEGKRDKDGGGPLPPVPIGAFIVDAALRKAEGDFVTFSYNETGIQGFTAGGVDLFNLSLTNGTLRPDLRTGGAQVRLEGEGFRLVVHDNPAGIARVRSDKPVALVFATNARLAPYDGEKITFAVGGIQGQVTGENLTLQGGSVRGSGEIFVHLKGMRPTLDNEREHIMKAVERRAVGVEASFNVGAEDVISYENVTLTKVKAEKGNLTVLVDGHGVEGRVVVLNFDGNLIGATHKDDLRLLFDNASMAEASGLADALDPDDDGLEPEWYLVWDPGVEAFQVIVSVPHYSVHTLSVLTVFPLPPPSVVFGVVAGVALLVPAAWLLFRRPRES